MRLFVGALLHLGIHNRDGRWHALRFDTEYVIGWLHPKGWGNRRRDWERFADALDAMFERLTYVHVAGVGGVAMVFPSVIPRTPSDPYVEFTVRIPAMAARGARIDWPRLCAYGTRSAAAVPRVPEQRRVSRPLGPTRPSNHCRDRRTRAAAERRGEAAQGRFDCPHGVCE